MNMKEETSFSATSNNHQKKTLDQKQPVLKNKLDGLLERIGGRKCSDSIGNTLKLETKSLQQFGGRRYTSVERTRNFDREDYRTFSCARGIAPLADLGNSQDNEMGILKKQRKYSNKSGSGIDQLKINILSQYKHESHLMDYLPISKIEEITKILTSLGTRDMDNCSERYNEHSITTKIH